MRTIIIVASFFLAMVNVQSVSAQSTTPTDYRSILRDCGAQWKADPARKSVEKGKGMAAWQDFRKACVAKSGYVPKRERKSVAAN